MLQPDHDAYRTLTRERTFALRAAGPAPAARPTPLRTRLGTLLIARGERLAPASRSEATLPEPASGRCP